MRITLRLRTVNAILLGRGRAVAAALAAKTGPCCGSSYGSIWGLILRAGSLICGLLVVKLNRVSNGS
jgi:hypothetical protein